MSTKQSNLDALVTRTFEQLSGHLDTQDIACVISPSLNYTLAFVTDELQIFGIRVNVGKADAFSFVERFNRRTGITEHDAAERERKAFNLTTH